MSQLPLPDSIVIDEGGAGWGSGLVHLQLCLPPGNGGCLTMLPHLCATSPPLSLGLAAVGTSYSSQNVASATLALSGLPSVSCSPPPHQLNCGEHWTASVALVSVLTPILPPLLV